MSRTWLITGASQGLGRALVRAALDDGERMLATSRRPEALADLKAQHPDRLETLGLAVTSPAQARDVVAAAVERFDTIEVVAYNAGYATSGSIEEFPEEEFRAQVETDGWAEVSLSTDRQIA